MLKCCWIKNWLDQFEEIVFGTNFPKLLMLAQIKDPNILVNFCLFDHWMTWNKWVMLNWSLIGLNFDLEQFSQIKVGLAEFNWIWNSLCFLYFDSLDEFNWFGKWWLWIQFDWNQIGLKTPKCQDFKACKMGLVLINCVRHYLMLKCMIKYANWCFRNIN